MGIAASTKSTTMAPHQQEELQQHITNVQRGGTVLLSEMLLEDALGDLDAAQDWFRARGMALWPAEHGMLRLMRAESLKVRA